MGPECLCPECSDLVHRLRRRSSQPAVWPNVGPPGRYVTAGKAKRRLHSHTPPHISYLHCASSWQRKQTCVVNMATTKTGHDTAGLIVVVIVVHITSVSSSSQQKQLEVRLLVSLVTCLRFGVPQVLSLVVTWYRCIVCRCSPLYGLSSSSRCDNERRMNDG